MTIQKMSISQALRRRKKLKGEIDTLQDRIENSLVHRKEDPPTFPYADSVEALKQAIAELIQLEDAVAFANAQTTLQWLEKPVRLSWAIRALAELKSAIARYTRYKHAGLKAERETTDTREELDHAVSTEVPTPGGGTTRRFAKKEIKTTTISNLTLREVEDKIVLLQSEFDKLNDLLETANHTTSIEYEDQRPEKATVERAAT